MWKNIALFVGTVIVVRIALAFPVPELHLPSDEEIQSVAKAACESLTWQRIGIGYAILAYLVVIACLPLIVAGSEEMTEDNRSGLILFCLLFAPAAVALIVLFMWGTCLCEKKQRKASEDLPETADKQGREE